MNKVEHIHFQYRNHLQTHFCLPHDPEEEMKQICWQCWKQDSSKFGWMMVKSCQKQVFLFPCSSSKSLQPIRALRSPGVCHCWRWSGWWCSWTAARNPMTCPSSNFLRVATFLWGTSNDMSIIVNLFVSINLSGTSFDMWIWNLGVRIERVILVNYIAELFWELSLTDIRCIIGSQSAAHAAQKSKPIIPKTGKLWQTSLVLKMG